MLEVFLLGAVRRGSENALGQLIDKYTAYVCVVIRNTVGVHLSHEDIEETASDVFFSLWENADKVQKVKPWLGATARNKAKNRLRGVREEPLFDNESIADDDLKPEDIFISDYERSAMKKAVLLLSSPDREIFLQHYYESRTVVAIAEELGMTEAAIKQRLLRGRQKLKNYLISQEVFCNV